MRILTDTERLNALAELGLCLAQNLYVKVDGIEESWVCTWEDKCVVAGTVREAIDMAVACIDIDHIQTFGPLN